MVKGQSPQLTATAETRTPLQILLILRRKRQHATIAPAIEGRFLPARFKVLRPIGTGPTSLLHFELIPFYPVWDDSICFRERLGENALNPDEQCIRCLK